VTSRIKHIGIMSQTPPRLFKFYECLFDFRTDVRTPDQERERAKQIGYRILNSGRVASAFARTVIASDGNIGVAFNQRRPGYPGGLDHFGMAVDDIGSVLKKIKEKYPSVGAVKRPAGRPFVDYSSHDPEGNIFDIAEPGKKQLVGVFSEAETKRPRKIKHFTIRAMNPAALAQFYVDVFEFKEEEKALEDPNFYLTDDTVTMVIAPYKISDYLGTEHKRPGFDHIGFEVEDLKAFKEDVELLAKHDPEYLAPKPPNVESEYQVIMDLLRSCRYGKHQLCDPEGNLLDISMG
jgi:catechol 2,3-dioxygenase-like lactoylglutathione lyase family enzyme